MVRLNNSEVTAVIMRNTTLFTHGSVFSGDVLDTMFGIELPTINGTDPLEAFTAINKRNLKRLSAYGKLNKLLAERGISIHQKTTNNQVNYHILTVDKLPNAVGYYRRKGKRASKRSRILAQAHSQIAIPGIE